MRIKSCRYNAEKDQNNIVLGRSIDLRDAFKTGVVKSTGVESDFNQLDNPDDIGERIEDEFDAVNHQRALQEAVHRNSKVGKSKNPTTTKTNPTTTKTTETTESVVSTPQSEKV